MDTISFNIENNVTEEIRKHKDEPHALGLIATLATDQQKETLKITIECKTKDNMRLIADDILGNILKSIANKTYFRSCKKDDVFLKEYFGQKNLEEVDSPPMSPDLFLNQAKAIIDVCIQNNTIRYTIYRKQRDAKCVIEFVAKEVDDIDKAFQTLSALDRDME